MRRYLLLVVLLMVTGCAGQFQADLDYEVDATVSIGQMQIVTADSGVLYDYFEINNAFSQAEAAVVRGYYDEMVRVIAKLRNKAVAGQVSYHRLKYAVEDLTDAWQNLRPELQSMIDIVASGAMSLEDRLAVSMWNRLSSEFDAILASANVTLNRAEDAADAATYAQFKQDAEGIVKILSPLIKAAPIPGL